MPNIPEKPQEPNPSKSTISIQRESFLIEHSGPLPPPSILEKYNHVVPGAAERIIKMAENQSAHRQQLEKIVIGSDARHSFLGVIFAFIIAMSFLAVAAYSINLGHTVAGTLIGTGGLTGLVSVFIYGTKSRRKEREERLSKPPQKAS